MQAKTHDLMFDAMDAFRAWENGEPEPTINVGDEMLPISVAFGHLWNCSDTMPTILRSSVADFTDRRVETIVSYAQGARIMLPIVRADGKLTPHRGGACNFSGQR